MHSKFIEDGQTEEKGNLRSGKELHYKNASWYNSNDFTVSSRTLTYFLVRKLQISLPDFRRLCIFKGIYPRQPRSRQKAAKNSTPNTTFYYSKDIQYLLHEPLLNKFREHNALAKKIARALGRGEEKDAARLERTHTPRMTLDHIVKERYPTFLDAVRDLDDALSMLFLFANLPSHTNVSSKTIQLCRRLCHEFQHYLIISHSLRKSFLSIKGIYYQASIQGQDVLWLVPYNFVQRVTGDIDFRIMATFVEFYTTLLGFVNYRLYMSAGFVYPPKFNISSDERGADLDAFTPQARQVNGSSDEARATANRADKVDNVATKRAQEIADGISKTTGTAFSENDEAEEDNEDAADVDDAALRSDFKRQSSSADDVQLPAISSSAMTQKAANLFKPFVFFLSRETPRAPLEFILKAFGCTRIGWNEILGAGAFTHDERDERITHQIVDRQPMAPTNGESDTVVTSSFMRVPGRTYIQPQWVWDSINSCELQRPDLYAPGATLPPHLSPFVKPKAGEYDPTKPLDEVLDNNHEDFAKDIDKQESSLTAGSKVHMSDDAEGSDDEQELEDEPIKGIDSVKEIADLTGTADMEEGSSSKSKAEGTDHAEEDFGGFSDDAEDLDQDDYERDLKAEVTGDPMKSLPSRAQQQRQAEKAKKQKKQLKEAEQKERQKLMLSRKKRELYERMEYGNAQKNAEADKLRAKRRKLDRSRT